MSRNLLPSAISWLSNRSSVKVAHLIRLEIPTTDIEGEPDTTTIYLTDYSANIAWGGQVYEAGKVLKVGDVRQTQGLTNYKLPVEVAGEFQEELDRGLVENLDFSYIGKELEVLRAYLDDQNEIVPFDDTSNGPMQYFIGDITDINVSEGVTRGSSKVSWQCAGKFQDFELINGRITDDKSHRGLISDEQSGEEVPSTGAKRVSHQQDRGFQHANQTINVISKYDVQETRYKLKKSWLGLKTSLKEYTVTVERELELGVDLSAKFLPKVYGVRKVPGIPVFIDTLKSDPSKVYVVYAFTEGEIDSFLNFYIDGQPIICTSSQDGLNRVCLGNQANGDTLSAYSSSSAEQEYRRIVDERAYARRVDGLFTPINDIFPVEPRSRTEGTSHEDVFTITNEGGTKWVKVYHGTSDQTACSDLVANASAENFLQQDTWTPPAGKSKASYWDSECRLLDTSYVVLEYAISEEESSVPKLEAVVSGSLVDTYDETLTPISNQYTLNPVWQLLDYIKNDICGGSLDVSKINLQSFYDVAQELNTITTSYDNDFITYWRYLGWKNEPLDQGTLGHDPQKTYMQCNTLLKTEDTVTKNIESLLRQFDGTLNLLGGKYHLSIENDAASVADLDIKDVVGQLATKDLSNKDKWNSIQAGIIDPGQGWNVNQINFFNSEYLKRDGGVHKKGNVSFTHLTNYYTAREWAQRQLNKSRFSREINFTTYFKYLYLYPNANVTFTYDRFGYDKKKFRVKSCSLKADGLISLTLQEYHSSIFDSTKGTDESGEVTSVVPSVLPPENLEYVSLPDPRFSINLEELEGVQGILVWDIPSNTRILRYDVRDWTGEQAHLGVPDTQTILDTQSATNRYYKLVSGLQNSTGYIFKVRTIAPSGNGSKYSTVEYTTGTTEFPVVFSPVTNFISLTSNGQDIFTGSALDMQWDAHPDAAVGGYEIQVYDDTEILELRTINTANTFAAYTLTMNMEDYTSQTGNIGAYRSLTVKIRANNGLPDNDPDYVVSEWTYLE